MFGFDRSIDDSARNKLKSGEVVADECSEIQAVAMDLLGCDRETAVKVEALVRSVCSSCYERNERCQCWNDE